MKRSYISPSLVRPPHYAHMVEAAAGNMYFSAGAVPLDASGKLVGENDIVLQTQAVVQNMQIVLSEQGLANADVVKMTVYVSGDTPALSAVWDELVRSGIANDAVAATLVGVASLGYPGQLVEIECIAVKEKAENDASPH